MFTGIVEETGRIVRFAKGEKAWRLTVLADTIVLDLQVGESVAVNGCCLTVTEIEGKNVTFEVITETLRLTSFLDLRSLLVEGKATRADAGVALVDPPWQCALVNLERSLRFDGKVGGHFVTGHIDTCATIAAIKKSGPDTFLRVEPAREFLRYVIYKGSIAIDGVSLTVAEVDESGFGSWLIPHTLKITNLNQRRKGDPVNLEFDLLGKYVEKLLPEGLDVGKGTHAQRIGSDHR